MAGVDSAEQVLIDVGLEVQRGERSRFCPCIAEPVVPIRMKSSVVGTPGSGGFSTGDSV
jgi:hypothetical protein